MHVVDSLEYGGLERVVTDLAIGQARAGESVSVFSILDTEGHRHTLEASGVRVIQGGKRKTADLRVLRAIRSAACGSGGIDVVHAHNYVPGYYAGLRRTPALVASCHDMGSRLEDLKLRMLFKWALGRTAVVSMVSHQVYQRLVEGGTVDSARARIIMNGIPTERFGGEVDGRRAGRATLSLPTDSLVIGAVGRLVPLKSHRMLIEAMPGLLRFFPNTYLVIVGDGPLSGALRVHAEKLGVSSHVHLTGVRDDVPMLLQGFDIFALPSETEGLSIALLEAAASGLPIVASDTGGNKEIVADDVTGLLVPVGDQDALQRALHTLAGDRSMRQRLGRAAREWALRNASIASTSASYGALYEAALAANGAGFRRHAGWGVRER